MLFDREVLVSDRQSAVISVGAAYSTDVIDLWMLSAKARDNLGNNVPYDLARISQGEPGWRWYFQVTEAFVGATATIDVRLIQATAPWTAVAGTGIAGEATIVSTGALPVATYVQGYRARVFDSIPWNLVTARYLGLRIQVATANLTAGSFMAGITSRATQTAGILAAVS